jgi:outer membrane autotransporter protein
LFGSTLPVSEQWSLGGFAGYTRSAFHSHGAKQGGELDDEQGVDANGQSDGYHSGLFASYQNEGGVRGIVSAAHSYFEGELTRNPMGTGLNRSFPRENVASIGADLEYDLPLDVPGRITPTASFRQVWARQNGIREGGGGNGGGGLLASQTERMTASQQRLTLGFNYARTFEVSPETRLTPSLNLGWLHTFGDRQMTANASFLEEPTTAYRVHSVTMPRDALHLKAGMNAQWGKAWQAGLNVESELRGNGSTHSVSAEVKWSF